MAVYADRVKETTTTIGTGTYNLDGAAIGFRTFVAGVGTGQVVTYACEDGTNWEIGEGTVTSGTPDTLSRTTILASSNSGNAVNWGSGTKNIFLTAAASRTVFTDKTNTFAAAQQFPAGSVSAPGITFSGDTDTGLYNNADNVNIAAGGKRIATFYPETSSSDTTFLFNAAQGFTEIYGVNSSNYATTNTMFYVVSGTSTSSEHFFQTYNGSSFRNHFGISPGFTVTGSQNHIHVYSSNSGGAPSVEAEGIDTNINLNFWSKGNGSICLNGTATTISSTGELSSSLTISSTRGFASPEYNVGNSGTAATINWNNGQNQQVTLTGNATLTLSNPTNGATYKLKIIQDGTGSRTVTFSPTPKWAGGSAPTLTTTANAVDFVTLYYDGTSYWAQFAGNFV